MLRRKSSGPKTGLLSQLLEIEVNRNKRLARTSISPVGEV